MKHNKYSIYYDHVGYTLKEWQLPLEIEVNPNLGLENFEAIEWGIEHGIFDLIPIASYDENGEPLDKDGEPFDEYCIEASVFTDKSEYSGHMIPFYEFSIEESGQSPYCIPLEELLNSKPKFREE